MKVLPTEDESVSRAQTLPRSNRQRSNTEPPPSKPRPQSRPRRHNDSGERPQAREGVRQEEKVYMSTTSEPSSKVSFVFNGMQFIWCDH